MAIEKRVKDKSRRRKTKDRKIEMGEERERWIEKKYVQKQTHFVNEESDRIFLLNM